MIEQNTKTYKKMMGDVYRYRITTKYQINFTYRCNLKCKWCITFKDRLLWPDSDITVEDIKLGGRIARQYTHQVGKLRIGGGEPLMHPQITECCKAINENWKCRLPVLFTNGTLGHLDKSLMYCKVSPVTEAKCGWRKRVHLPPMISPMDLGLQPELGFTKPCKIMNKCGRLFDAFGFSFCPNAGIRGRLLGIDSYQPRPVLLGIPSMCQHCIFTIASRRKRSQLWEGAMNGKIEYPTKTYKEGLKRALEEPIKFKKFQERYIKANKEEDVK